MPAFLCSTCAQAKNPTVIQSHLKKLYAGIHKVAFSGGGAGIGAMSSMDGEVVELSPQVGVTEQVERWLNELTASMRQTLKAQHEGLRRSGGKDKEGEFSKASSQVLCLRDAVIFTER